MAAAPSLRTVRATRYVTPLREGGSLPAIVEADDDGLYVMKFRGAGQGVKALIAELVCGELARALGLRVPELVFVELDAALARLEGDPEIQQLLKASIGLNVGLDYLPGSITHEPAAHLPIDAALASRIVWFDALITNVDRTARNPNLLWWHHALWLIDHGAALLFQHAWERRLAQPPVAFRAIKDHVLLNLADALPAADAALSPLVTDEVLRGIAALIPAEWLAGEPIFPDVDAHRRAYVDRLRQRAEASAAMTEEAVHARAARL